MMRVIISEQCARSNRNHARDEPGIRIKVHRDGTGAPKHKGPQAIGKSRGGWNTKVHLVATDARAALAFSLSGGQAHDAPEGRALLQDRKKPLSGVPMLMDRAYEGDEIRELVLYLGFEPVVP